MKTEEKHEESGCTDYLQHSWQSCPENPKASATPEVAGQAEVAQPKRIGARFGISNGETDFIWINGEPVRKNYIIASVNNAEALAEALNNLAQTIECEPKGSPNISAAIQEGYSTLAKYEASKQ
jgi:hypothetical protein